MKAFLGMKKDREKYRLPGVHSVLIARSPAQHSYEVRGDFDKFTDEQLLSHCDGGSQNFGGRVEREKDKANVIVYVD